MNRPKFTMEEVYNHGYDTAGNYHIYGVFSGHTVIVNKLPDNLVLVQDEDGTVTVIMSNRDYKENNYEEEI